MVEKNRALNKTECDSIPHLYKRNQVKKNGPLTSRQRLMATLEGKPVDRVPVNLYELGGFDIDPSDPDEFNVYKYPTWKPLLELTYKKTDLIRMVSPTAVRGHEINGQAINPSMAKGIVKQECYIKDGSRFSRMEINIAGRKLETITRRDPDINTTWVIKHLIENIADLEAYLKLPEELFDSSVDVQKLLKIDEQLGDTGIVMVESEDPICVAASLFSMEDFTVVAMTERSFFHRLLEKVSDSIYKRTEKTAREFPGHLWRIFGPEYASEPYLPPELFKEYVVRYTTPMIKSIKAFNGFARIHSHGRLKNILDFIVNDMMADAIDPVEAPPNGDVSLRKVSEKYGKKVVIFGNIQISDIETMPSDKFEKHVRNTIQDGLSGEGRGFVLMPTSSPYGREITPTTLQNYQILVKAVFEF
ncbi:MAG: hypothetical protein A2Y10_10325 [Planctomycetes bacterium GWF2_41_51]|nr:MAG: hypothetical protein A2Y10_10325 [Planctomycetes bacterium GWF2_41_51]HBG27663.1 hypothetical protein [Phycisphaerales bacterium]